MRKSMLNYTGALVGVLPIFRSKDLRNYSNTQKGRSNKYRKLSRYNNNISICENYLKKIINRDSNKNTCYRFFIHYLLL